MCGTVVKCRRQIAPWAKKELGSELGVVDANFVEPLLETIHEYTVISVHLIFVVLFHGIEFQHQRVVEGILRNRSLWCIRRLTKGSIRNAINLKESSKPILERCLLLVTQRFVEPEENTVSNHGGS